jgi:hypothetical protein
MPATIRRDFALLCRKTTADCLRNDCIVVRKLTALCQQIVSTFFLAALHFLERRIGGKDANALYLASRKGEAMKARANAVGRPLLAHGRIYEPRHGVLEAAAPPA